MGVLMRLWHRNDLLVPPFWPCVSHLMQSVLVVSDLLNFLRFPFPPFLYHSIFEVVETRLHGRKRILHLIWSGKFDSDLVMR